MQAYGNNIIVVTYLVYLLISVALTVWVARTLYQRGAIFLVDAFFTAMRNWPHLSTIFWWWAFT